MTVTNSTKCNMSVRRGKMSGVVHIRVEVHRNDSEMDRLVKQSWLQLMCCTVCLPHGHNFR